MNAQDCNDDRLCQVREGYTRKLRETQQQGEVLASCCGSGYSPGEIAALPREAAVSSFGCGNPLAFSGVQPGQTVLDIGSGAGIDCFLAAQKVGPSGRVIGLDMTPAMIEKAAQIARDRGYANVEFRLGAADAMPVEDASVDWIISNCVINLAPDKSAVFREAYRVLKPGGRVAISDIVLGADLPPAVRDSVEAYLGCVAGAIREDEYLETMRRAGFQMVEVVARQVYDAEQIRSLVDDTAERKACCGGAATLVSGAIVQFAGKVWSAQISALKEP